MIIFSSGRYGKDVIRERHFAKHDISEIDLGNIPHVRLANNEPYILSAIWAQHTPPIVYVFYVKDK